ncbi:hypothetical protein ACFQY0_19240 [Haloferula chungangensis]|uniref:Uncharacterized protein n=1 Tax=Haloferula chungangensis TaxID=1048331 RepID=A0ABW2LEY2_9BACT
MSVSSLMRSVHGLIGIALISTLTAGELGKGMKLEYGERGLAKMKLGEQRKVGSVRRVIFTPSSRSVPSEAECLRRLREIGIRVDPLRPGSSYRVKLGAELRDLRYQGKGAWAVHYRGTKFVLTDRARAEHASAIRKGRASTYQMSFVDGNCHLKSMKE